MPPTKLRSPVDAMELEQPFGVNYVAPGFYSSALAGMAGPSGVMDVHNGWDFKAKEYSPLYAVMDGEMRYEDLGLEGKQVVLRNRDLGLEVVYGHVSMPVLPDGPVKAGMPIAQSGNNGRSTGPHLHFGVREFYHDASGAGPFFKNPDNGHGGFVDPIAYFPEDVWYSKGSEFVRPVDGGYGFSPKTPGVPSVAQMAAFERAFRKDQKREMTDREGKALRFGFWDLATVLDPAMFPVWSKMSKPEAVKRGIVKP